eukprot:scaffold191111_cov34-Tisochrysis_lutea.AAC.2
MATRLAHPHVIDDFNIPRHGAWALPTRGACCGTDVPPHSMRGWFTCGRTAIDWKAKMVLVLPTARLAREPGCGGMAS